MNCVIRLQFGKNMSIDCGPRAPNHEHVSYYVHLSILLPFQMNTFSKQDPVHFQWVHV